MDGSYLEMIARRELRLPYMAGKIYLTTESDDRLNPIAARSSL